jgi:hypothetical protein
MIAPVQVLRSLTEEGALAELIRFGSGEARATDNVHLLLESLASLVKDDAKAFQR